MCAGSFRWLFRATSSCREPRGFQGDGSTPFPASLAGASHEHRANCSVYASGCGRRRAILRLVEVRSLRSSVPLPVHWGWILPPVVFNMTTDATHFKAMLGHLREALFAAALQPFGDFGIDRLRGGSRICG